MALSEEDFQRIQVRKSKQQSTYYIVITKYVQKFTYFLFILKGKPLGIEKPKLCTRGPMSQTKKW